MTESHWKQLKEKVFVDHSDCLGNPIHKPAVYLEDLREALLAEQKKADHKQDNFITIMATLKEDKPYFESAKQWQAYFEGRRDLAKEIQEETK